MLTRSIHKLGDVHGELFIDLPKLISSLEFEVRNVKGQKVYRQQVDYDTRDLLTKMFNSNKKYSDLAVKVFNDLNILNRIPIYRSSKKYTKLGGGTGYFKNESELFNRSTLIGGSIPVGNTSNDVREEFSEVHCLSCYKTTQCGF